MAKITDKIKKGKRSASKREKRRLLKKHKDDPSKLAEKAHIKMMEKVIPEWENQIQKEEEYLSTLSKRERKFRAVQKILGIVQDVKVKMPIPALVSSKNKSHINDQDQEKYEKMKKLDAVNSDAKPGAVIQIEQDTMKDEVEPKEEVLYDLWENTKSRKKKDKPRKIESAGRLLNTVIPHPGQSYNPDIQEYQKALSRAGRIEAKKVLKEHRIERRLNADSHDPNVQSGGHDALDGLNIQRRAQDEESQMTEESRLEKQMFQEELRRLKEKASKPKPIIPKSQLIGRKIHKMQLSKKQRKVRERYHKVQTLNEQITEAEMLNQIAEEKETKRLEAKRRLREIRHKEAFASISDATDILLPQEMPTRMSSMGQNMPSYINSQVKLMKGTHAKLM